MDVLALLKRLKSLRDLAAERSADLTTHLAVDPRTRDKTSNITMASKVVSLGQVMT